MITAATALWRMVRGSGPPGRRGGGDGGAAAGDGASVTRATLTQ
jgi:hypothetical protein